MNVIPPPPPGMSNPYSKHDGYEQLNGQFRSRSQAKRKRAPVEDQGAPIDVQIRDTSSRKYITPSDLKYLSSGQLGELGDTLEYLLGVCRAEESGRHRQRKDVNSSGRKLKSAWHCEPSEGLPVAGSVSFPFQTTFKATSITDKSANGVDNVSPQMGISQDQSTTGNHETGEPSRTPIFKEMAPVRPLLAIKVSETQKWEEWFHNAFKVIQQQQCRFIAKEWIKLIHPRKQSTHPYNGNFPRNHRASPERTKPPYWPKDVRHKEPDHIDKDSRTILLVYLVMQTPQQEITPVNQEGRPGGKLIMAANLLECLAKKKDELKDKWDILEQLIEARTQLESFEEGGTDADTVVNVPDYRESTRPGPNRRKSRARAKQKTQEEQTGDSDSRAESPSPPTSPAGTMIPTPAGSDDEEDYKALNASFSSDVTQMSSLSSTTALPGKYDEDVTAHFQMDPAPQPQSSMIMVQSRHNQIDFTRHDQVHHRQSIIPSSWPTTHSADPGLTSAFADEVMVAQSSLSLPPEQFDHAMSAAALPPATNSMMYTVPYDGTQQFTYNYHQQVGRNMIYRSMAEMGHEPNYGPEFTLHDEYNNLYGSSSRQLQR